MGCVQSSNGEEDRPTTKPKSWRLSSLPPKEAYERLAAARLTREQNAAAELLRACLDSSAPQRSGLLRPDERCDDLVRVVQKSQAVVAGEFSAKWLAPSHRMCGRAAPIMQRARTTIHLLRPRWLSFASLGNLSGERPHEWHYGGGGIGRTMPAVKDRLDGRQMTVMRAPLARCGSGGDLQQLILHAMEIEPQFSSLDPVARRALMSTMCRHELQPKQSVHLHDLQRDRNARALHSEERVFFGVVSRGALEAEFVSVDEQPALPDEPPCPVPDPEQAEMNLNITHQSSCSVQSSYYDDSVRNRVTSLKLSPGCAFGSNPSITMMTAIEPTETWVLDFRAFMTIVTVFTDIEEQEKRGLLASVPSFSTLSTEQLGMLVGAMERRTYEEGEKIVMKGEVVDTFYIIQSGEVQLEEERAIAKSVLGPGQFFGERSILQDTALDVSVISIGEKGTMCYCLDRQSFQDILGPIEDVWRWRALRGVHLLAPLSETQPVEVAEGDFVFKRGDEGSSLFIVESGSFQVLTDTKPSELGGDEVTRHLSGASYCTDLSRQFSGHGAYHLWHDSPVTPERLALAEAATWRDSGRQIEQPIMMQRRKSEIQARLKHVDSNVSVGEESRESLLVMPLLTKGDYFGEYALLSKHPRSASVQAKEVGVLLELTENAMRKVVGSISQLADEWRMRMLKLVPMLSSLTIAEKKAIAHAMKPCSLNHKQVLFKKGDWGDCMYFLEHGNVKMHCRANEARTFSFFPGSFFGVEQAVCPGERSCTVRAVGTPLMLMLRHENLSAILGAKLLDLQKGKIAGPTLEQRPTVVPSNVDELAEVSLMGVGAYGKVSLVRYKREQYALKAIMKRALIKMRMVTNLDNERAAMIDCQNAFTVQLLATYQDHDYVYMLMEPLMGGDLRQHTLRLPGARLPEEHVRFYVACCVQALKFMHSMHYVHRDIKTENLLFMRNGYLKLADFGFAKQLLPGKRTYTSCGTPLYMAPEIISMTGHSFAVDWWSLGVLMYELICGHTPFGHHKSETEKLRAIVQGHYHLPSYVSEHARSLISKLLTTNPAKRLGNLKRKEKDIILHPWFEGFDWEAHAAHKMPAPYIPLLRSNKDLTYVDHRSAALTKKVQRMQMRYLHNHTINIEDEEFPNF